MATYKDDLDILKAAEKDSNKLSLNAITELDNKGLLGMYGGGGSEEDLYPDFDGYFMIDGSALPIDFDGLTYSKLIAGKEPKDESVSGVFFRYNSNMVVFCNKYSFDSDYKIFGSTSTTAWGANVPQLGIVWHSELELEDDGLSGILQPNTWYLRVSGK